MTTNTKEDLIELEWRELGPYEEIQAGDEVFTLGMWVEVTPNLVIPINKKENDNRKFRTRRPLPVPDQSNKNMVTNTPRTDALMRPNGALATNLLEHARQLEMELNNRAAEIDMLKNKVNALKKEMKPHIEPDPDEDQI
jgi:hypothetical protein